MNNDKIWKYSTFILAAVLIVGAFMFFTMDRNPPSGNAIAGDTEVVTVNVGDSPVLGSASAPVTIVEFSDYECPFCARHFSQTYPQLLKDYIESGKVKLVFKDFPLSFHENAAKAAEAARCVREQLGDEGYYAMHDKLFSNSESLSIENEKKWAREIGADGAQFDACLDSGKYYDEVQADQNYGISLGVQGTPAFFVNGKRITGAQPYSVFKQAIDAELAG